MTEPLSYADAGVDIDKANELVGTIKDIARQTTQSGVLGDIGGFGGLFAPNLAGMESPVLVSSTDGVGTKLKIAFMMDKHDTVGIDLVAMCVNDIIVQGANPLFFLDYLSIGRLDAKVASAVINGIGLGCQQAKCALIGGETAEMPGMYQPGEYDLAGFTVGLVDRSKMIDGSKIEAGHQLVGIASSGLHSNGFSLVRKICFEALSLEVNSYIPEFSKSLGEELLTPTKIYVASLADLLDELPLHGLAHITGGGLGENIERVIPDRFSILLRRDSWDIPIIFRYLQESGNVTDEEMRRTFNNGLGMVAAVPATSVDEVMQRLTASGETAYVIGEITERQAGAERVQWT